MSIIVRVPGSSFPVGPSALCASCGLVETSTEARTMSYPKSDQIWSAEIFARIASAAFPASTAWYLSEVTGISAHTVKKHLRGEAKPGADHCLAYLAAGQFGQCLAAALVPSITTRGEEGRNGPTGTPEMGRDGCPDRASDRHRLGISRRGAHRLDRGARSA